MKTFDLMCKYNCYLLHCHKQDKNCHIPNALHLYFEPTFLFLLHALFALFPLYLPVLIIDMLYWCQSA